MTVQSDFLAAIKTATVAAWADSKILPSVTAAQAILESDWGRSGLGAPPNNNLFGVKAGTAWIGDTVVLSTQEYGVSGWYYVNAAFRKYGSWAASIADRGSFFTGSTWARNNYSAVIGEMSYSKACWALSRAGYATDPQYAPKLINIIETYDLDTWDKNIDKTTYVETVSGKIDDLIGWFESRLGKVTYSMAYRNGPNSYDCSSAVYYALIHSGFLPSGTWIGNTESLYGLEGDLLLPIAAGDVVRGDIFVSGEKGGSGGAYGHAGVSYGGGQIIHCNYGSNGIAITSTTGGWIGGPPTYWYRLKGSREQVIEATKPATKPAVDSTPAAANQEIVDIKTINDNKNYLKRDDLEALIGVIYKTVDYEVESKEELKALAQKELDNQMIDEAEVDISAVNLARIGLNYEDFKKGNLHTVDNELLNTFEIKRIISGTDDIINPEQSQITLGRKNATMTDYLLGNNAQSNFTTSSKALLASVAKLERDVADLRSSTVTI